MQPSRSLAVQSLNGTMYFMFEMYNIRAINGTLQWRFAEYLPNNVIGCDFVYSSINLHLLLKCSAWLQCYTKAQYASSENKKERIADKTYHFALNVCISYELMSRQTGGMGATKINKEKKHYLMMCFCVCVFRRRFLFRDLSIWWRGKLEIA